jgi:hypothetical protein
MRFQFTRRWRSSPIDFAATAMMASKRKSQSKLKARQISRIRLSDKTSRLHPRHVVPKSA